MKGKHMKTIRTAAVVGAAVTMAGTALVSTVPASAATINVALDCQGSVSVTANPGDQVVFTLGAGCPVETGGADPGHYGGYLFSYPIIGFGWLSLDGYVNEGPLSNPAAPDFWDIRSDGSGTTTITTTLMETNPNPLEAGVSVIGYTGVNGMTQFDVLWSGPGSSEEAVAVGAGIPDRMQQVAVPSGSTCATVDDAALAWGTGLRGGWSESWAEWAHAPVCTRTLHYNTDTARWELMP